MLRLLPGIRFCLPDLFNFSFFPNLHPTSSDSNTMADFFSLLRRLRISPHMLCPLPGLSSCSIFTFLVHSTSFLQILSPLSNNCVFMFLTYFLLLLTNRTRNHGKSMLYQCMSIFVIPFLSIGRLLLVWFSPPLWYIQICICITG